jgi:hypothetical protein
MNATASISRRGEDSSCLPCGRILLINSARNVDDLNRTADGPIFTRRIVPCAHKAELSGLRHSENDSNIDEATAEPSTTVDAAIFARTHRHISAPLYRGVSFLTM